MRVSCRVDWELTRKAGGERAKEDGNRIGLGGKFGELERMGS